MKTINAHHQALLESQVQTFCTCWWLGLNFRNPEITTIERGTVTTIICNFGHGLQVDDTCILKGVKGLISASEQAGSDVDALSDINDDAHADFWRVLTVLAAPDPFTAVVNFNSSNHSQYESGGIVRKVLGYTDHLTDISMDGFKYKAELGYKPTSTETASSGAVDTVSIQGFMPRVTSDCEFNEGDILSGVYDNAELRMFLVDYDAPEQGRIWLRRGYLGEVEIGNEQYEAEVLSLVSVLSQPTLNLFSAECRHDLGDNGCRVNPSFQYSEISNEPFTSDNLAGSFIRGEVETNIFGEPFEGSPTDRFQYGRIRFLTGQNAGLERAIGRTYIDTISEILERFKGVIDYTFPVYPGGGATQQELDAYEARKIEYEGDLFELVVKDLDANQGTQIVDSIAVPRIDYPPLPTNFIYMPDAIRRRDVWRDRLQSVEQGMRMGTDADNLYGLTLPGLGNGQGGELYLLNFRESGVDLSAPVRLGNPLDGSYHYLVKRVFQQKAPCVLEDDGNNQDMVFASDIENKLFGIKEFQYQSNTHGQIKRVACNRLQSTELLHNSDIALAMDQKRPLLLVKHNPDGNYEALSGFMQYRFEIPVIVNVPALATAKSNASEPQTNNAQPPTDPGPLNPANTVAAYFDAQHIPGTDTFMAISPDDTTSNLLTEFGDEAQLDLKLPSVFDSALNPTDNVELSQFRKAASSGSASITRELREAVLVGNPGSGALILANDPRIFPGAVIRVEIQSSVFSLIGEGLYVSEEDAVTQADIDAYQEALAMYNEDLAAAAANTEPPNQKITRRENTNTLLEPVEDEYRAQLIAELQAAELYDIVVLRFDGDYIGDFDLLLEDSNGDTYRYQLCQPWNGECVSAEKEGHCFRLDKIAVANGGNGVLQILDDRSPANGGSYPNPAPLCYDHPLPFEGTIPDEPVLQGTKTLLDFNAESTGVAPQNFVDAGVPYSGANIPAPILINNVDTDFGDNYVQLILAVGRKYFVYTGGSESTDSAVATQVKTTTDQFNRQPSVVLRANSQRLVELRFANQFKDLELWDVAVPTGAQTIRARVDVSDIVQPDTIYQIWLRAAGNRCFFALRQTDETVLRSGEGLTLTTTGRPGVGVTVSEF